MFGNDSKKVAEIEARVDWLSACACVIVMRLNNMFKLNLPPPPPEANVPNVEHTST